MVRLLIFLLLLVPSLALAQAEFSTIISPTTFPITGSVGVTGTVSTSPTGPSPVTQSSQTSPWQVNVGNNVTIAGTVTTSLPGTNLVSPSIPNWPININQVNSLPISNAVPVSAFISNVPAVTVNGTVTTSGNTPVAISGTAAVSSSAATWPVSPTVNTPVTEATSPWQVNVGNSLTVGGTVTVSTSSAPQPVTQSSQTSPWQVNVGNTVTVSTASATQPVSQTQVVLTSEKGMGYADRLNWVAGSAVTTNSTLLVLVKAPVSPSKLFITSAQCSRTDSPVGSVLFVALNNLLTNGTSTYLQVPAAGVTVTFPTPLVISPTTSLFMQASTNVTSVYCNAQGYQAP